MSKGCRHYGVNAKTIKEDEDTFKVRPQGRLYFTDMSLSEEEHTDTGLSDTAADSIWKLRSGLPSGMEVLHVVTSGFCKLCL